MLGHLQASLHGPRSIAIFSVWNLQKTLLSFQPQLGKSSECVGKVLSISCEEYANWAGH
jgi:hypothetical protein